MERLDRGRGANTILDRDAWTLHEWWLDYVGGLVPQSRRLAQTGGEANVRRGQKIRRRNVRRHWAKKAWRDGVLVDEGVRSTGHTYYFPVYENLKPTQWREFSWPPSP